LKIPVGERIARWALATQYGMEKEIKWKPPMLKGMKVENGKIILQMDTDVRPVDDGPIAGFAIAGKDRRFQPARADFLEKGTNGKKPEYDRKVIVLSSPHVPEPIHFRYAWARNPMGNLQSADHNDLPFAGQRSDDWKMEEVPLGVLGNEALEGGKLSRGQRGKIQQVLRLEDIGRRLRDAQAFIDEHKEKYEKERAKGQ
jgi:sialate O-acetylesterase